MLPVSPCWTRPSYDVLDLVPVARKMAPARTAPRVDPRAATTCWQSSQVDRGLPNDSVKVSHGRTTRDSGLPIESGASMGAFCEPN
eukprot:COSAG02_NODE_919_length_15936_cov_5.055314_11_plen_86_part_00